MKYVWNWILPLLRYPNFIVILLIKSLNSPLTVHLIALPSVFDGRALLRENKNALETYYRLPDSAWEVRKNRLTWDDFVIYVWNIWLYSWKQSFIVLLSKILVHYQRKKKMNSLNMDYCKCCDFLLTLLISQLTLHLNSCYLTLCKLYIQTQEDQKCSLKTRGDIILWYLFKWQNHSCYGFTLQQKYLKQEISSIFLRGCSEILHKVYCTCFKVLLGRGYILVYISEVFIWSYIAFNFTVSKPHFGIEKALVLYLL